MTADPCRLLEWDSEFFGCRIARFEGGRLQASSAAAALSWCEQNRIDCLYFLAKEGDPETLRVAEQTGFQLVDIRVTLTGPTAGYAGRELLSNVRMAKVEDVEALCRIARTSHHDSRFWADGRFRHRCGDLFAEWIRKSCVGWAQAVLVVELDDRPAGWCASSGPARW
jgi:hypothetical protein